MTSPSDLFIPSGNTARSQLAQVLPEHHGGARFRGVSAGLEPVEVQALTLNGLEARGLPTSPLQARGWRPLLAEPLTCGVTVRDRAEANGLVVPHASCRVSWAEIDTCLQTCLGERA